MKIVTFDGHSGAGKSTQARHLAEHYSELNIKQIGKDILAMTGITDRLFNLAGFGYSTINGVPDLLRLGMLYRMMLSYEKEHECDLLIIDEYFLKSFWVHTSSLYLDDKLHCLETC